MDSIADLRNRIPGPGHTGANNRPTQPTSSSSEENKRRINISGLEKMPGDISLKDFQSWRTKWSDFCLIERQVPTVNVQIFDSQGRYLSTITAVPDSGAEATVAGLDVLKMLDGDVENLLHRGADNLVAANGLSLETAGRMDYIVRFRGSSTPVTIIFSPEHSGMLLSWFVCVELGLLPTNYPEPVHVNFINGAVAPDSAAPSLQTIHVDDLPAIKEQLLKEFVDVFDCNCRKLPTLCDS